MGRRPRRRRGPRRLGPECYSECSGSGQHPSNGALMHIDSRTAGRPCPWVAVAACFAAFGLGACSGPSGGSPSDAGSTADATSATEGGLCVPGLSVVCGGPLGCTGFQVCNPQGRSCRGLQRAAARWEFCRRCQRLRPRTLGRMRRTSGVCRISGLQPIGGRLRPMRLWAAGRDLSGIRGRRGSG